MLKTEQRCSELRKSVGMEFPECGKIGKGDRKLETFSCRGEDLASALMLRPRCRNQVSSISECGDMKYKRAKVEIQSVGKSGSPENAENAENRGRKMEQVY